MEAHILVIGMIMNVNSIMNVPTFTVEFNSLETCQIAKVNILKEFGHLNPLIKECVKK